MSRSFIFAKFFCKVLIAVNTRFLLKGKLEGIGWFTNEILKRMVQNHPEHQFLFIFDRPYDASFIYAENVIPVVAGPAARHPLLWYFWFECQIPRLLKKYKADVFFSPDCFNTLQRHVPSVMVIHDLAYYHYPQYLKKIFVSYLKYFTPRFIKAAQKVIAVSHYTRQDIHEVYQTPLDKIEVVYNSANDVYVPMSYSQKQEVKIKYAEGCEYFLYAGSLHPRKNIVNLLKAFALFKRHTKSNMKLILVGRLAWKTADIEKTLFDHPFAADIIRIEYLDAGELCLLMGAAYCLTYVSVFEGFGIPILEALRCHTPVICSNSSSMPEVGGEAVLYVNPTDVNDIAEKMLLIFNDEQLRSQLVNKAQAQAEKFSWHASAEKLYQILVQTSKSK